MAQPHRSSLASRALGLRRKATKAILAPSGSYLPRSVDAKIAFCMINGFQFGVPAFAGPLKSWQHPAEAGTPNRLGR